jgi:hypothetical protein
MQIPRCALPAGRQARDFACGLPLRKPGFAHARIAAQLHPCRQRLGARRFRRGRVSCRASEAFVGGSIRRKKQKQDGGLPPPSGQVPASATKGKSTECARSGDREWPASCDDMKSGRRRACLPCRQAGGRQAPHLRDLRARASGVCIAWGAQRRLEIA